MSEPIVQYVCGYEPKPGKRCGKTASARRDDVHAMLSICPPCLVARRAKGEVEKARAEARERGAA